MMPHHVLAIVVLGYFEGRATQKLERILILSS